mgnify:CR=1 FL=1
MLIESQKNDLKTYNKKIKIENLKDYIKEYGKKDETQSVLKSVEVLLPGNPEIVFKLCLEAVRHNISMTICIDDFCISQNSLLINFINQIIIECNLTTNIRFKKLVTDEEIVKDSKSVDKIICIGNSNLYYRLKDRVSNLKLNPYGIIEMYSDSEDFEEIKQNIYEFCMQNQFEIEMYDDLKFNDAIEAIIRDGYGFCSILISKDNEKIKMFKEKIDSKHVIINKNPFKEITFCFDLL